MISCLCITKGDRQHLLAEAVADFSLQTWGDRELVILHDAGTAVDAQLRELASHFDDQRIRVVAAAAGGRLGQLRNRAVACASGEWICQWDDDDRYHPQRLALQLEAAEASGAHACYLVDQLHLFAAERLLCWDDWHVEPYPMNLIQGTVLARRERMPPYPDIARGEDTAQTEALLRASATDGWRVARLRDAGWCYVYRTHGANAWDAEHHRAISAAKHMPPARLLARMGTLRRRAAEYWPPLGELRVPVGDQTVVLSE